MNQQRESNQTLDCAIAQDLLPLYHDGVVSTATGQALRQHLEHCKACRRDYEDLREILPVRQEDFATTKERFLAMERKLERRRIFRVLWTLLAAVAVVVGGWYLLTQASLRPADQRVNEIVRAYRYEEAGKTHFLILSHETVDCCGSDSITTFQAEQEGDTCLLQAQGKTNLLGGQRELSFGTCTDFCLEEYGIAGGDIQKVLYQGQVAWTEGANGDDPLPDYVPLYFAFQAGDKAGSMTFHVDEGYVQASFQDGRVTLWDLDGTVLYARIPGQAAPAFSAAGT